MGIELEVGVVDACAAGYLVAVRVDGRVRGEPNAFHSFRFFTWTTKPFVLVTSKSPIQGR